MRIFSILGLLISVPLLAQTPMDDLFYSSGKIYVVVTIMSIIFIAIALYLFRLDSKIKKLEKEQEE